jgi:hypothetical protein
MTMQYPRWFLRLLARIGSRTLRAIQQNWKVLVFVCSPILGGVGYVYGDVIQQTIRWLLGGGRSQQISISVDRAMVLVQHSTDPALSRATPSSQLTPVRVTIVCVNPTFGFSIPAGQMGFSSAHLWASVWLDKNLPEKLSATEEKGLKWISLAWTERDEPKNIGGFCRKQNNKTQADGTTMGPIGGFIVGDNNPQPIAFKFKHVVKVKPNANKGAFLIEKATVLQMCVWPKGSKRELPPKPIPDAIGTKGCPVGVRFALSSDTRASGDVYNVKEIANR